MARQVLFDDLEAIERYVTSIAKSCNVGKCGGWICLPWGAVDKDASLTVIEGKC